VSYGSFTERTARPSTEEMVAVLGRALPHWKSPATAAEDLGAKGESRF